MEKMVDVEFVDNPWPRYRIRGTFGSGEIGAFPYPHRIPTVEEGADFRIPEAYLPNLPARRRNENVMMACWVA